MTYPLVTFSVLFSLLWLTDVQAYQDETRVRVEQHVLRDLVAVNGSDSRAGCQAVLHSTRNKLICNSNSLLIDGMVPLISTCTNSWAREFVTMRRNGNSIYLAFRFETLAFIDKVSLMYVDHPASRIGLPLVKVYWLTGSEYLNPPHRPGKQIGVISSPDTDSNDCRLKEASAELQQPAREYLYVGVEFAFSTSENLEWVFLAEMEFIMRHPPSVAQPASHSHITPSPVTPIQTTTANQSRYPSSENVNPMSMMNSESLPTYMNTVGYFCNPTVTVTMVSDSPLLPSECSSLVGIATGVTFIATLLIAVVINAVGFCLCVKRSKERSTSTRIATTNQRAVSPIDGDTHSYEDVTGLETAPANIYTRANVAYRGAPRN